MNKKKTQIFYLIFAFLIISTTKQGVSQSTSSRIFNPVFKKHFTKSHTISLNLNNDVYLGRAVSIFKLDNHLFWGEKNRLSYFNKNGKFVESKDIRGRGPGEVINAVDYDYNSKDRISVLDFSSQKIKIYDKDLNFVKEFTLDKNKSSKITLDNNNNNSFTLNELLFNYDASAISEYDSVGNKVGTWGNIPKTARVQRSNEDGGGITADNKSNIYYSYQGNHKIWKFDTSTNSISVFNNKPSYFKFVDAEKIKNTKGGKNLFFLGYEGTRVIGLFYLEPNIIIQLMETGNPFATPKEELAFYLEVWNTDGRKLASKLQIPFPIAWANDDSIAILKQYSSGLLKESGRIEAFDIFQHKFGK